MMDKAELRDAIIAAARHFQGIAELSNRKAKDVGPEEAEKYEISCKSFLRKVEFLKALLARLNQISLEDAETDFENIKNSV